MTAVYDAQGYRKGEPLVAKGLIVGFHGPRVPSGWGLCDGTLGTPDLRGAMVLGDTVVGLGSAGGAVQADTGLVHVGFALGNHSNHVATQPAAHSAHIVTQPSAHSNHTPTQAGDHGTHAVGGSHTHNAHTFVNDGSAAVATNKLVGPTTHVAAGAHAHDAHSAHSGFAVNAHSAHSGAAVDAHSAHSGFAVDAHAAHAVIQPDTHSLKGYRLALIMKR